MLRIPKEGDEAAPLMAPLKQIEFAEDGGIDPRGEKRTRSKRKKKPKEAKIPEWDASTGSWRSSRKTGKRVLQTVAVWFFCIAAILGVAFYLVKAAEPEPGDEVVTGNDKQDQFDELVRVPLLLPEDELEDAVELPKVMQRSEIEFIALAQPIAEKFLNATEVDQILPLVNDAENVSQKIRDHYPEGKINAPGLSKFNSSGRVSYKDSFAAVTVLTPDYQRKQLAFIDTDEGLKIDWESWVGWSEIPWEKLSEERPPNQTLVRAMLKWVDYYNFAFADEDKWRSYRLLSPDGENMLYGYTERNSLLDQRLRPGEQNATVAVTLKIHFPEGDESGKQVVIDEYIADGWVVVEGGKSSAE